MNVEAERLQQVVRKERGSVGWEREPFLGIFAKGAVQFLLREQETEPSKRADVIAGQSE